MIGGHVYRGTNVPEARGRYFYGDWCPGMIWSLKIANGEVTEKRKEPFRVERLASFGESAAGELFLVSQNGGIYRLAR